jgi:hypothetical protein
MHVKHCVFCDAVAVVFVDGGNDVTYVAGL